MSASSDTIPVILFAYARPDHLARTLESLRANAVPRIVAFADGPKGDADAMRVAAVRTLLRGIDWCDVRIVERRQNLGLGRNVLAGVGEVAAQDAAFVVWEDDLVAMPGAYAWMCSALEHYAGDHRVMSVTAWTHPRVTPPDVGTAPYFDARGECWVWGAWARSWLGMAEETALQKLAAVPEPAAYGADLPLMAEREQVQNIWAVRWLYHHLQHRGLCVRPPWSMVEHIGFDPLASNAASATAWANPPLRPPPPVPATWPQPHENPHCRALWLEANPPAGWRARVRRLLAKLGLG